MLFNLKRLTMKKIFLLTAAVATFGFTTAQAQNGIYMAIDAGIAKQNGLNSQTDANVTDVNTSYSPNAVRLSTGYNHDFNSHFGIGLDVALAQYGKTTYTYNSGGKTDVTSRALEFLAISTFHLNKQFDVFAKAGGLRITPKVSGVNAPAEGTQIFPEAALGTAYNLNEHLAFTFTYAHVFGNTIKTVSELGDAAPGLDEMLLGIKYNFGS
jgi:OOP family OmpA-OmpF porin